MRTTAARAVLTTAPLSLILPLPLEPVVDALRRDNPAAKIFVGQPQPKVHTGRFRVVIVGAPLKLTLSGLTAPAGLDLVDLSPSRPADKVVLTYDLIAA